MNCELSGLGPGCLESVPAGSVVPASLAYGRARVLCCWPPALPGNASQSPGEALPLAALKGCFVLGALVGFRVTGQTRLVLLLWPLRSDLTPACAGPDGAGSQRLWSFLWVPGLLAGTGGHSRLPGCPCGAPCSGCAWAGLRLRAFQTFLPAP